MGKIFNAKAQRREGAKVLKNFGSCFGKHGLGKAIFSPALVNLDFSALRPGGFAPLR
jgi:hypothetical protein